jgi:hypothetical protein
LGTQFVGCLIYADDVPWLAPTIAALRKMLTVCEEFSREFKAMFNAEKSLLLVMEPTVTQANVPPDFTFLY